MKKLLLISAFYLISYDCISSHMMGGQITSRNIGGLTYEVTATVYRDVLGVTIAPLMDFHYDEVGGPFSVIHYVPHTGAVNIGNGVEEYTYKDTIIFPNGGNFTIWMESCCRNHAILNMSNPGGETFHLYNEIWVDPSNSSPVFLNPPIPVAQLNTPFTYNPMPFDADGDSLVWNLDTPLAQGGGYVIGFTLPSADPLGPFTLNPATGEISFIPDLQGHFEASFVVEEFRNGTKIGQIRRDMQIIVEPSPNNPPLVIATSNASPYSGKTYNIGWGNQFNLTISAYDTDGNTIGMIATGEPMLLQNNAATFTTTLVNPGEMSGTFTWTPDVSHARPLPYLVSLRISDNFSSQIFQNDITFSIGVGNFTSVEENQAHAAAYIFPNPGKGDFMLELIAQKSGIAEISISNMLGQNLTVIKHDVNAGVNLVQVHDAGLPKGNYILTVRMEGQVTATERFVISN